MKKKLEIILLIKTSKWLSVLVQICHLTIITLKIVKHILADNSHSSYFLILRLNM